MCGGAMLQTAAYALHLGQGSPLEDFGFIIHHFVKVTQSL